MTDTAAYSYDYINESLSYDPNTGFLTWRERPVSHFFHCKYPEREQKIHALRYAGNVAGTDNGCGYKKITISQVSFFAHRLAWLLYYKEWPTLCIDHIDGNPSNNRISNLRIATVSQNNANCGVRKHNRSGYKGVTKYPDKPMYYAFITVNRRRIYLGSFTTAEAAHDAYKKAAIYHHGSFAKFE